MALMGGDYGPSFNPWELVPWWHPRRWFGHSMRRWTWDNFTMGGEYDGNWVYATYNECARITLEETYGS